MLDKNQDFEKFLNLLQIGENSFNLNKKKLLDSLGLSDEDIQVFIANKDNFSPAEWNALQELSKKLDLELKTRIESVANPEKTKEAQKSLHLPSWALHCK